MKWQLANRETAPMGIEVGEQHRYTDFARQAAPWTAGTRAEIHDAARSGARDGAPQQPPGGLVGPRQIQRKREKIGERIAQRGRARRQIVKLDQMETHAREICTKRLTA